MGNQYQRGSYWVKITHQEFGEKGKNGTPCLTLDIAIAGQVNPMDRGGDLLACPTGNRRIDIYLTEGTMEFAVEQLRHIGFDKPSLKYLDPAVDGYHNFVGKDIEAYCKLEPYNGTDQKHQGKEFEKWSISLPREREPVKPLATSKLSKLDTLFGAELKKQGVTTTRKTAKKAEPVGVPVEPSGSPPDDDIPF